MGVWYNGAEDSWESFDTPSWPEVTVTERQVVDVLLGPDGEPLIEFFDREPIGFRLR